MEPPRTRRIRLTVQYDGSAFFGWQLQPGKRTVQGELERVASRLFTGPTRVVGSGRTDRGVHAIGQVATIDAPDRWSAEGLRRSMNALLDADVWVADAREVAPRFHPRYDAVRRSYVYRVGIEALAGSPFHSRWCWPFARPLDRAPMEVAAATLPGDHSFLAFAKAGQEHRGDRCIVQHTSWAEWEGLGLEFRITANRFLHHMVRYLVGTMVEIGAGRRPAGDMSLLLTGVADLETSPPAPPQGLFLAKVEYGGPDEDARPLGDDEPGSGRTSERSLPSPPSSAA